MGARRHPGGPRALRAAVVGAGVMGRRHSRAIARAGGELVAVADQDTARAAAVARGAATAGSLDSALAAGVAADVVHVCTPLDGHAEVARQAIEAGAHVIVEKPLTADASTTRALLDAGAARGVLVVPVHQFLFQQGVQRLLERRSALGEVVRCAFTAATAGAEKTGMDPDDLVGEILPHPLSLFARLVDAGANLGDLEWAVARAGHGELRALAVLDVVTLEIVITTRARPPRAELEVMGTRSSARADLFHGFATMERGSATPVSKALRPFDQGVATVAAAAANLAARAARRQTAYPGLDELVAITYDTIRGGLPAPIAGEETLAVARARDAILASRS